MKRTVATTLFTFTLALLAAAAPARAEERLAVVVLVEGDPAMSDSLAEIAIAHLAESRGGLVALRELRGRLPTAPDGGNLETCLARGGCLTELGRAADASRALVGTLAPGPQEGTLRLVLSLGDTQAATVLQSTERALPRDPAPLADGLRTAIEELLPPPPKVVLTPPAPAPQTVVIQSPGPPHVAPMARSTIVGISLAGLAAASLVTAAVLGATGSSAPEGATREQAQNDLHRRETLVAGANILFVAGGALAAASAGVLIWHWK
jgi:hypothetical protein